MNFNKNLNLITVGETRIVSAVSCMNYSVKWLGGFQSDLEHKYFMDYLWFSFGELSDIAFSPSKLLELLLLLCQIGT